MKRFRLLAVCALLLCSLSPPARAQGKGDYRNPVLFADYSDPDVIRDGDNYYLVASTFSYVPGLPILQSNDLVHWTILTHVLPKIKLDPKYDLIDGNRYGRGVWAPALRRHDGLFYLYFPTPDEGIFVSTAAQISGPWSDPVTVMAGPGLEDPCPFWDDDGNAYLVHSKLGAGPLILHRMAPDGKSVLDEGKEIVRDPQHLRTLEGPKIYKRHGFYYIFAPYGGVSTGAQAVLRSKSIYGPYDYRTVLAKGKTEINGPHQGGYIETQTGEGWFMHFQSRGAHGRILHLEPVRWEDDWPIMGDAKPGEKTGQPVAYDKIPKHPGKTVDQRPQTSDEFTEHELGQQWEWNHNPDDTRWSLTERPGYLRLHPTVATDLFTAHNTLTQMMQDESLEFTTKLDVGGLKDGGHTGLAMFEKAASGLEVVQTGGVRILGLFHGKDMVAGPTLKGNTLQLRVHISVDKASYSYSLDDGKNFIPMGEAVPITFSWWKGSRPALFAWTSASDADAGQVDFDWAHYRQVDK